jgi:hypothetical protein
VTVARDSEGLWGTSANWSAEDLRVELHYLELGLRGLAIELYHRHRERLWEASIDGVRVRRRGRLVVLCEGHLEERSGTHTSVPEEPRPVGVREAHQDAVGGAGAPEGREGSLIPRCCIPARSGAIAMRRGAASTLEQALSILRLNAQTELPQSAISRTGSATFRVGGSYTTHQGPSQVKQHCRPYPMLCDFLEPTLRTPQPPC